MWRSAASAILLSGLVLGGVRAGEDSSTPALGAPPELVSPYQQYDLKLAAFSPAPRCPVGVLLHVRINGGRPLRLVLDSGAEFMVIGAKDARSVGLTPGPEMDLVGLENRAARVGRAEAVEIGPLSFRNCRVAFVKGKVIEGADGVIPLSLFSAFRLRLDLPDKTLGLIPYPREEDDAPPPTRDVAQHDLLLLATVLNGKQNGYVVVDTGAFCSAISREAARTLRGFPMMPEVRLSAGTGAATGQRVSSTVHFAIADQDVIPDEVVALDLSNLSRHYGLEVVGVLGFPALRPFIITIDYRNRLVKIEPKQPASPREAHRSFPENSRTPLAFR
jgi:hypothetical protein